MEKSAYIYIMTNKNKTTLYVGVTNNLVKRVYEHKKHLIKNSFTDKYNLEYCIYYEEFAYFSLAIHREKELKKWNRKKKEDLINKINPKWIELVNEYGFIGNDIVRIAWSNRNSEQQEIPRFTRNDTTQIENIVGVSGGEAAANSNPCSSSLPVIPNEAKRSEESF